MVVYLPGTEVPPLEIHSAKGSPKNGDLPRNGERDHILYADIAGIQSAIRPRKHRAGIVRSALVKMLLIWEERPPSSARDGFPLCSRIWDFFLGKKSPGPRDNSRPGRRVVV